MNIDVKNLLLRLHNSHIVAKNFEASYKNIIHTFVDLDLKLAKDTGFILFHVDKIRLQHYKTALASPVKIHYYINKQALDTITIPKTTWHYANTHTISIGAMKIPFNFTTLALHIPVSKVDIDDTDTLLLSGEVGLKQLYADMDIDLIKMRHKAFKMAQSNIYLHLTASNGTLKLTSNKRSYVTFGNTEFYLDAFSIKLHKGLILAKEFVFGVRNYFHTNADFSYDIQKQKGELLLQYTKLFIKDEKMQIFESNLPLKLKLFTKNGLHLYGKSIATSLSISPQGDAKLHIQSLKNCETSPYFFKNTRVKTAG